jgi:two-component system phosphate regulon response regulator PhoB
LKIIVIDTDGQAVASIRNALERPGDSVQAVASGEAGLELAAREAPDLIITEMRLPDVSGIGLCRAIREHPTLGSTRILMVGAGAAEMDRIVAFEVGIDDFLAKPFNPRELALRVRAILRRARSITGMSEEPLLVAGPIVVDNEQHMVRVDGRSVPLTAREFDVLVTIVEGRGRVLGRRQILERVWGDQTAKTPRVVDTHVKWIRRKLGRAGACIETMRGVGYRLADSESARPVRAVPTLREPAA